VKVKLEIEDVGRDELSAMQMAGVVESSVRTNEMVHTYTVTTYPLNPAHAVTVIQEATRQK
jgi:hypothetical protein